MGMLIRRMGLYRHAGRLGVFSSPLGDGLKGVFLALDPDGRLYVDWLDYEPELVASNWSELLPRVQGATPLSKEVLEEDLDSFYDYVVNYTVTRAEELSSRFPAWVRVDPNDDEVRVVWAKADVYHLLEVFRRWSAVKPQSFRSVESCQVVYQTLSQVECGLEDFLEVVRALHKKPTHYEHVLYAQAALAFVSETIKRIRKTEGVTVQ